MHFVASIITLVFGISLFIVKSRIKLVFLVFGFICFDCFSISELAFTRFKPFLCLCYFISELKNINFNYRLLNKTPLLKASILATIAYIITIAFSSHLRSLTSIVSFLILGLFGKYYVITYGFTSFKKISQFHNLIRVILLGLLLITFFAILNFILGYSPWVKLFGTTETTDMLLGDRLRLTSTFIYTFDYGQICNIILYSLIYSKCKGIISNKHFIGATICCCFGIIMCGSRSVLGCGILGLISYALIQNNFNKNLKIFLISFIIIIITSALIPEVQDKINFLLSAVDTDSNVSGSSANMRIRQYATVIMLVSSSPFFGLGYHYFYYDLGWSTGLDVSLLPYPELAGLEGVLMGTLLERGIVGVLFYLIYYLIIIRYAYSLRKYDRAAAATCIAIIISFIAYGNMTGELNSGSPTLLFAGIFLKIGYLNKLNYSKKLKLNGHLCNYRKLQH